MSAPIVIHRPSPTGGRRVTIRGQIAGLAHDDQDVGAGSWPPLGAERAALEAYERQVVGEKLTQFRRFITGTVAPHAAAHPNDKWVRHIVAQLNSIESTLDLIASA
ncbi:hypothetical protein [[Kitasatospora] papulosa]|uniref:Uncharacterized protein n=1 Tax=Streptomyces pratensis (strain ATCC 33331 / IAF-45CD) TaxID=591167 RepID=A0A8D3WSU4_STRFA